MRVACGVHVQNRAKFTQFPSHLINHLLGTTKPNKRARNCARARVQSASELSRNQVNRLYCGHNLRHICGARLNARVRALRWRGCCGGRNVADAVGGWRRTQRSWVTLRSYARIVSSIYSIQRIWHLLWSKSLDTRQGLVMCSMTRHKHTHSHTHTRTRTHFDEPISHAASDNVNLRCRTAAQPHGTHTSRYDDCCQRERQTVQHRHTCHPLPLPCNSMGKCCGQKGWKCVLTTDRLNDWIYSS